jgi:hypothetical protein
MKRALWVLAFLSPAFHSVAHAAPTPFFNNLAGNWSGLGHAYLSKMGEVSADCRLAITGGETQVAMNGSCGLLMFRQHLGFSIRNAGGNKYLGLYTGSRTGPAKLEGTLQGERLVMTITWGGLVNGHRTAQMILERTGPDSFVQRVIDNVAGKSRTTSNFEFKRG